MCGRYTLTKIDPATLRARFGFDVDPTLDFDERPRFNIAPTDPVLAIRTADGGRRELGRLRWGLLPGRWAQEGTRALINARAETLETQPAYRESFLRRRCLIPADGFCVREVSDAVNDVREDGPHLLAPPLKLF